MWAQLLRDLRAWDLVTDDLIRLDVQDTCDHEEFFVFEEQLEQVMLAFSRDPDVPRMAFTRITTAPLRRNSEAGQVCSFDLCFFLVLTFKQY